MNKKQKGYIYPFLVVIIALLGIAAVGYLAYKNNTPNFNSKLTSISITPTTKIEPTGNLSNANWKKYNDSENRFGLKYPDFIDLNENNDNLTLSYGDSTGDDPENSIWLSIFIIQTTLDEYLKDNPCEGKDSEEERNRQLYKTCKQIFEDNKQGYALDGVKGIQSVYNLYENDVAIILVEQKGLLYLIRYNPLGNTKLVNEILATFEFTK